MNIALLHGALSSDPVAHELPSGARLVRLEVTTRPDEGAAESVPVAAFDPPATVDRLGVGDLVVVRGRVRRRFYRQGGTTRSATEVVAERVVPATQRRRSASVAAGVAESVESFEAELAPGR